MNKSIFILSLILCLNFGSAQENSQNQIQNAEMLAPFFQKLEKLESENTTVLNIVHIGDSHIQADMMTEQIRTELQQKFRNAGRGFIFPYQLAKTNGTELFKFESDTEWTSQRMVFENLGYPTGLSGIALFTENPDFLMKLKVENEKYNFNRIKIVTPQNRDLFMVSETPDCELLNLQNDSVLNVYQSLKNLDEIYLKPNPNYQKYVLNGLILENGNSGIIYHSIGVNGAKFLDYNKYPLFFEQLKALNPDLIIISLGTNEAFDKADFTIDDFRNQMDEFLINLTRQVINVPMIFTTPPPALVNKKEENPKVAEFGDELLKRSTEINYAVWDMFRVLGGYQSKNYFIQNEIWAKDRVHFSEKGYQQQAELFVEALLNAFTEFQNKNSQ